MQLQPGSVSDMLPCARPENTQMNQIDAGRKYVAAYVDFTHYVERLDQAAGSCDGHHETASASLATKHEQHRHELTDPAWNMHRAPFQGAFFALGMRSSALYSAVLLL